MENTIYKQNPKAKEETPKKLSIRFKDRSMYLHKKFSIGRDASNDISLADDPLVSRQHAVIEFLQGVYYLRDLGSTNGTYLNKNPVRKSEKKALNLGDIITIGKTTITVSGALTD